MIAKESYRKLRKASTFAILQAAARLSPSGGTTFQTTFPPPIVWWKFHENPFSRSRERLFHIFCGRKKTKKNKKNTKTSVKHIRYRLIGGCVNKQLFLAQNILCLDVPVGSAFSLLRFAVEPADTVMTPGAPGRLDCSVTSSSDVTAPEIQWLKDDSLIGSDNRRSVRSCCIYVCNQYLSFIDWFIDWLIDWSAIKSYTSEVAYADQLWAYSLTSFKETPR